MRLWVWGAVLLFLLPALAAAQGPRYTTPIFTATVDAGSAAAQNGLMKFTTTGTMTAATASDTAIPLFVCINGCSAGLPGTFVAVGEAACTMDETTSGIAGQFVVVSPTAAPACHRVATAPTNGYIVGIMADGSITNAQAALIIATNLPSFQGSVSGTGVNAGAAHKLAYYPNAGTIVDDLPATPTANRGLVGDGTDWITSTVSMAGAGACTNQVVTSNNANAAPTCTTITPAYVSTGIALTGSGINTSSQPVNAPATWAFLGIDTPTTLSGNINDYASCPNMICKVDGGAADRNWTGLAAATTGIVKELCNAGATKALILKDQNTGSTATNRFALGSDVTLQPGQCKSVWYDTTRWKLWEGTVSDPLKIRSCSALFGTLATGATALDAADDGPGACGNDAGIDVALKAVALKCDGGVSTFTPILTGGSATSIVSAACTCGAANVWVNCPLNGAPVLHSFAGDGATCASPPCTADMNITTADGVTKQAQLKLIWSLP